MAKEDKLFEVAPKYDGTPSINPNPFIDSPAEFLSKHIAIKLRQDDIWKSVFGSFIDAYPRDDYGTRNLPALRIYNEGYIKEFDSWFIEGNINLDIILPATLRRLDNQEIPDLLASALLQQFRRPSFFTALCDALPGLNELGKTFEVDKTLGFKWGEKVVPLTQILANFRIDLREWDNYLTETCRTKDEPFQKTLGELKKLVGIIEGLDDEQEVNVEIGYEDTLDN